MVGTAEWEAPIVLNWDDAKAQSPCRDGGVWRMRVWEGFYPVPTIVRIEVMEYQDASLEKRSRRHSLGRQTAGRLLSESTRVVECVVLCRQGASVLMQGYLGMRLRLRLLARPA